MDIIEDDQHWEGRFLIGEVAADDSKTLDGMIYVYYHNQYHYGIHYNIVLVNGRVQSESELWLGNLYLPPTLQFPNEKRVPYHEWFDYQTQPVITVANPDDPHLIGIEEHEQKNAEEHKE